MVRFWHRRTWYERLAPAAQYESEFEALVEQDAADLFPDYTVVPFRRTVESELGGAQPDLAAVANDYGAWIVIEIELIGHSLQGHVVPQINRLLSGAYTAAHADFIHAKAPELSQERLRDMMKGLSPSVLVVVNEFSQAWADSLAAHGANLAVFEPYRSDRNDYAYRVMGLPIQSRDEHVVSRCEQDRTFRKFLQVGSPGSLPFPPNEPVQIEYDGSITHWRRVDSETQVWLIPRGPFPLADGGRYLLVRRGDVLELERER